MEDSIADKKIFIAGATGAIGYKLCLILRQQGYIVYGMTRSLEKAQFLEAIGVFPVTVDIFDLPQLTQALEKIKPDVVIHQLTDLPYGLAPALMEQARVRNANIRKLGTQNLLQSIGEHPARLIVQSIAFAYIPEQPFYNEDVRLDVTSSHPVSQLNAEAVEVMEQSVAESGLEYVILRYGKLYGAGTGSLRPESCKIHVDAAAYVAYLAIQQGHGIYQIVENDPVYQNDKAKHELGFSPDYRWQWY